MEVYLHTEKGAKYIAGIIKLDKQDLKSKQGHQVKEMVHKCLDAEAMCQFRIQIVSVAKNFNAEQISSYKVLR